MIKGILLLTASLFLFACEGTQNSSSLSQLTDDSPIAENTFSSAVYPLPQSLNSLEDKADLIVRAKMSGNIDIGDSTSVEEETRRTSALSQLEILEVYKGDETVGEDLTVTELFYMNNNEIEVVEQYVPMETDEDYILFLSNWDGESWRIEYMGFGKYHLEKEALNTDFQELSILREARPYAFITEDSEQVELYQTIRKDVLDKYTH